LGGLFDLAAKMSRIAELEQAMARPGFWDDQEKAQKVVKEISSLKGPAASFARLQRPFDDLKVLV